MRSFLVLVVLAAAFVAGTPPAGAADLRADFNGDGFDDLAVGAPFEAVGPVDGAGVVHVLYGSEGGLSPAGEQLWSQAGAVFGVPEHGDQFGFAVATGDFDGNGFADLAVGVPGEEVGGISAGGVNVLYGFRGGLATAGNRFWSQAGSVAGAPESGDRYGSALASGDFDADGFDDLAVGVPGEYVGAVRRAGGVSSLYGSQKGLTATANQFWSQGSRRDRVREHADEGDLFGSGLAAGDFDGDGFADLAVGAPGEDSDRGLDSIGAVNVLYGSGKGLVAYGNEVWSQFTAGGGDSPGEGDRFGAALAAADFDGDGFAELAIGVPGETVGTFDQNGAVNALFGSVVGLTPTDLPFFSDGLFFRGRALGHQYLGSALAAGDFDGDGFADLAVGAPGDRRRASVASGSVYVLEGREQNLDVFVPGVWSQADSSLKGDGPQRDDGFGSSLAAGNFGNGPEADLAVGVPGEDLTVVGRVLARAGAVNVLYGSDGGISSAENEFWTAPSAGQGDWFGFALPG